MMNKKPGQMKKSHNAGPTSGKPGGKPFGKPGGRSAGKPFGKPGAGSPSKGLKKKGPKKTRGTPGPRISPFPEIEKTSFTLNKS